LKKRSRTLNLNKIFRTKITVEDMVSRGRSPCVHPVEGEIDADTYQFETGREEDETLANRSKVIDLTGQFKGHIGTQRVYSFKAEQDLASYTITLLVNKYGMIVRDSRNMASPPVTQAVETDVREMTTTYRDVTACLAVPRGEDMAVGMVQSIQLDDLYRVSFCAASKEDLDVVESEYNAMLESENYFQGKTLRFSRSGLEFMVRPGTTFEDAILPQATMDEYRLNVMDFLTNLKMSAVTKKRGIILYGPPGTGKTTSIKAMFNQLSAQGITCIQISDDAFRQFSVEQVFDFVNKYLAPCLLVFEDIDLIAMDRSLGGSAVIGPLLSLMNGIEEQQKPIVVLATTNRPEVLDAAITRPCRFDRKIKIDFPSDKELAMIFKRISGFDAPEGVFDVDVKEDKKLTGAHVEEIYRTAALTALKAGKKIEECVVEAAATVKKYFQLVSPSRVAGFGGAMMNGEEMLKECLASSPGRDRPDPFRR